MQLFVEIMLALMFSGLAAASFALMVIGIIGLWKLR